MKKLISLCFVVGLLSLSLSVLAERIFLDHPIPKPKVSIEKALELARAEFFKGMDVDAIKSSENILLSVEYCSYNEIILRYNVLKETMEKFSKERNWEWIIKFSNTEITDDYSIFMVSQDGKVLLVEMCCL